MQVFEILEKYSKHARIVVAVIELIEGLAKHMNIHRCRRQTSGEFAF
jgi:hypothetical protein